MDRHEPAAPRAGRWIRRPTEWSVRARLLLLVLSVALPTTLALGLAALDAWRNARERTATLLRARTEAVAATIGRELGDLEHLGRTIRAGGAHRPERLRALAG